MAPSMQAHELAVPGAFRFVPQRFADPRGWLVTPYEEAAFVAATGHRLFAVRQTNHSCSRRGAVRGVHLTASPPGMAKYVHCARGRALDIVVDLRVGAPTFGTWDAVELDAEAPTGIYLPVGVGHAFVALADDTVVHYLLSTPYVAEHELAVSVLDPALGLPLPDDPAPLLSDRDRAAPTLAQAVARGLLPDHATAAELESRLYRGENR